MRLLQVNGRRKLILIYAAIFAALFIPGLLGVMPGNMMRYLLRIMLYATLGEMWNLLSGYAGMTSLGQQTYIGLAGYSVALATSAYSLNFQLGLLLGAAVSVIVAVILSYVLFRIRGMYFSIATWVIAEAFAALFLSLKYVGQGAGMTIDIRPYPSTGDIYLMSLALCFVTLAVVYLLLHSKTGIGLTAMRDDTEAASAMGINIRRMRFIVYVIAAVFTAFAGGIFFINKGSIYPESGFNIGWTISMVFIVIIGGVGTIEGPMIGAVIYVVLQEFLAHLPGWSNIILGLICIMVILFMPKGIAGFIRSKHK